MLPSPSSLSPPRPVLVDLTNEDDTDDCSPSVQLLTPPPDRKRAPPASDAWTIGTRKRVKLAPEDKKEIEDGHESDSEDEQVVVPVQRKFAHSVYGIRSARMMAGPSSRTRFSYCQICRSGYVCVSHAEILVSSAVPTRSVLQSFVSSNKCDVFRSYSIDNRTYMSPPYACAFSNNAKSGRGTSLAIASEQGVINVVDAKKRREWDVGEPNPTSVVASDYHRC